MGALSRQPDGLTVGDCPIETRTISRSGFEGRMETSGSFRVCHRPPPTTVVGVARSRQRTSFPRGPSILSTARTTPRLALRKRSQRLVKPTFLAVSRMSMRVRTEMDTFPDLRRVSRRQRRPGRHGIRHLRRPHRAPTRFLPALLVEASPRAPDHQDRRPRRGDMKKGEQWGDDVAKGQSCCPGLGPVAPMVRQTGCSPTSRAWRQSD